MQKYSSSVLLKKKELEFSTFPFLVGVTEIMDEMDGTYTTHGRDEKCIKISIGKAEGKRQLGRLKRRWEDNIKMGLKYDVTVWTGFICLWIWSKGGFLLTREILCSIELVS
jgi:hypothetical protein